jgi:TatD DNase family protein
VIDTHCHLTFPDYDGRVERVLADAAAAGVRGCIVVSTTAANATACLALAEAHANVWCTSGVHPLYADAERDWGTIGRVAAHEKCVAWGELGLDNHYARPPRRVQDDVLSEQLGLIESCAATGLEKPIVVHCRKAVDDLLEVFRGTSLDPQRFVFHCFTGTPEEARRIVDFGAWISFTGVVTFRNAPEVAEAARIVPSDRIMVETDSPFLSPEPLRTMRPNEPRNVVHIGRFLAALRGEDPTRFEAQLDANAERFFGIRPR